MLNWILKRKPSPESSASAPAFETPIAIVFFNRPGHVLKLMDSLRPLRPNRHFLIADGPRAKRPGEAELCATSRRAALDSIDWPAKVETSFSDCNLGCRRRVSSGLDWVFSKVTEAIILEDDLEPHASFFPYCAELLDRYRDHQNIGAISGNCFQPQDFECGSSYYFSVYAHCWGWATWRRAWKHYDHELAKWPKARESEELVKWLGHQGEADHWKKALDQVASGKLDSWATIWMMSQALGGMLAALPSRNLVSNHGFGSDATHTTDPNAALARLPVREMSFPMIHPESVTPNTQADSYTRHTVFQFS